MDTYIFVLIVLGGAAAIATVVALVTQRAPRVPTDPARLIRLRDRITAAEERRHHDELQARIAAESDARHVSFAPQRSLSRDSAFERLWARGF